MVLLPQMNANGPAIKLVGAAERMKAVTSESSSGQSPGKQPEGAKHGAFFAVQIQFL